jgi:hypothetical protein
MMGSCAFLMPASSVRFIRKESYHAQAALGLALGGIPAGVPGCQRGENAVGERARGGW